MTDTSQKRTTGGWRRGAIAIAVLFLSIAVWLWGLLNSDIAGDERGSAPTRQATRQPTESVDDVQRRRAAESYWERYPEIREHHYFGEHGPLGIDGARQHYLQHGRHEGRIYQEPVSIEQMKPPGEQPRRTP
jgi:hypothetical protein